MKKLYAIALIFSALLLSACSVPGTFFSGEDIEQGYAKDGQRVPIKVTELNAHWLGQYQPTADQTYHIGAYDILNIIVWDHPELTTPTTQTADPEQTGILVNGDGTIFFPFAGKIKVAGLTLDQTREVLEKKLDVYIRDPQLSVRVAQFRSQEVQVIGEVNKPGVLPITDKPLTAMEAINRSGGVNSITANTQQIFILAQDDQGNIIVHWFNAQHPAALLAANTFRLHNNVIIYVPPAGISAWNRVITQVIPILGSVNTGKSVANVD